MSEERLISVSGVGLSGALFLVFLTLKLTGNIGWSWWLVTAPLWVGPVAVVGAFVCFGVLVTIICIVDAVARLAWKR